MAEMVDQTGTGPAEGMEGNGEGASSKRSPDSIAAEMNRKFDKIQQENMRLSQQIEALTNSIVAQNNRSSSAQVTDEESDLEDLAFKDPKMYAKRVKEQARNEAQRVVVDTINTQQRSNNILSQLVGDYPELSDSNSELTSKSIALYKQMSDVERSNPLAYKAAVRDAAAELGVLPKSKRSNSNSNDEFQFSASNPRGEAQNSSKKSKSAEVDDKTMAFAKLLGLNTDDKKVQERLKVRQERKDWNKYR
jgi:hypothetical protein